MLDIEDLTVRYGSVTAVRGVSLTVEAGEVVGVIGPNGAGKSSTLRAICGVAPVRGGTITVGGTSIVGRSPERIVESGVALVPEGRRIFADLTVRENLLLAESSARARARRGTSDLDPLDLFPILRTYRNKPAGLMSGGEQQQLAIARALMCHPDLILLDEPSFGLAPKVVDAVFEVLSRLRDEGLTILVVEQMVGRVLELASRSYVMANGRVVAAGTREELLAMPDFERTYLGMA
jgi:branched-chain amino acid transport system ATP-binding protein